MQRFPGTGEAQPYLERHVPTTDAEPSEIPDQLKGSLFHVPDNIAPGRYELSGPNGLTLTIKLVDATDQWFENCWQVVGPYDKSGKVTGSFRPIYRFDELQLTGAHFSFDQAKLARPPRILWLPNLRSTDPSLDYNFAFIEKAEVILLGDTGRLSTPDQLLSMLHEVGHIESRPISHSKSFGGSDHRISMMANELQRERDANAWLLRTSRALFDDLALSPQLAQEWVHQQLHSYEKKARSILEAK